MGRVEMSYSTPGQTTSDIGCWETPFEVFDWAEDWVGAFDLDAAASEGNALCPEHLSESRSAFLHDWGGEQATVWCNPPYGRGLRDWAARASEQVFGTDRRVVMLVPARTDTRWWATLWRTAERVRFIRGRLKFRLGGLPQDVAPFPSALLLLSARGRATEFPVCSLLKVPGIEPEQPDLPFS